MYDKFRKLLSLLQSELILLFLFDLLSRICGEIKENQLK